MSERPPALETSTPADTRKQCSSSGGRGASKASRVEMYALRRASWAVGRPGGPEMCPLRPTCPRLFRASRSRRQACEAVVLTGQRGAPRGRGGYVGTMLRLGRTSAACGGCTMHDADVAAPQGESGRTHRRTNERTKRQTGGLRRARRARENTAPPAGCMDPAVSPLFTIKNTNPDTNPHPTTIFLVVLTPTVRIHTAGRLLPPPPLPRVKP
eukprot:scaffold1036_cov343-Prasinococcus_capsulatus_cf.AAC.4